MILKEIQFHVVRNSIKPEAHVTPHKQSAPVMLPNKDLNWSNNLRESKLTDVEQTQHWPLNVLIWCLCRTLVQKLWKNNHPSARSRSIIDYNHDSGRFYKTWFNVTTSLQRMFDPPCKQILGFKFTSLDRTSNSSLETPSPRPRDWDQKHLSMR